VVVISLLAVLAAAATLPAIVGDLRAELVWGGAAVALSNGFYALRLMFLAAKRHFRVGSPVGPCYTAGFLGVGLLAACVEGAALSVSAIVGETDGVQYFGLAALGVTACAYVPGMLMLPGAANSLVARLRRGLDGLSVGSCLLFVAWLLVISPNGAVGGFGFWVSILVCCALSVAVVCGVRAGRSRRGALACAGGAAVSVTALGGLTLSLAAGGGEVLVAVFSAALAAAPAIAWLGVRSTDLPEDAGPPEVDGTVAGYPVLAVPAAAAIAVALHRLLTGGAFDHPAVVLGVGSLGVVALRETIAAIDVSRYARRVAQQEAQFRNLVAGSTDVIMVLDADFVVRWQSPAAARQLGLSDQEVVGRHFQSMVHPEDAVLVAHRLDEVRTGAGLTGDGNRPWLVEARLRDGFGLWRETESSINDQREVPQVGGLVVHIRDVSERKEMERTLHRLAYADQLTGLANRRQMLLSVVGQRSAPRVRGALLLLELDGFNAVNDVRGYDIGDAVLVEVARRLRAGVNDADLPARLSGDEFAVVTEVGAVQAYALATRLLTMMAEPIVLPGVTVRLSASVGLSDLAGGTSGDDVLRRADLALRRAKQLGRGRVEWYDEAVEKAMLHRMILEQELPDALVRGELDLIYQPILDLVAPRPLAVEALLRWRHPRLGTLLPADVIPVAEDLGLINEIGSWVTHQAGRQLATWLREGRNLSMAVNVSPRQLEGPELFADVSSVLGRHGLPPDRLVLEVAEGGLATDTGQVSDHLIALRTLGVRTALDEFGTGPDSLAHLRSLPMDMVKIGRSFFDDPVEKPGQSVPIIDVMVGLGRRLGIDVVAQGLEAPAHLAVVRGAGCRLGQGHLFARPQPAEHVEAYLDGFPARAG
jgi:diguanylate cyclase (GGDEF)-like protein/PAS domain S-box-containing protein